MRAVDTNIVVRLLVRDDRTQTEAAERFIAPGAWVPTIVLAETIWVLTTVYELQPAAIAKAVEMVLLHEQLVLENAGVVLAALQVFRSKPRLGFTDCLIAETARQAGHLPLGTFDRNLSKLDGVERL